MPLKNSASLIWPWILINFGSYFDNEISCSEISIDSNGLTIGFGLTKIIPLFTVDSFSIISGSSDANS